MLFKKLKLVNIRSYTDLEIEFPQGSILLAGDIGAGKTSILLGLQFALFGLQPGQKGDSILRSGTNNAYTSLEIEIDHEKILIERTIKKNSSGSITQDTNIITIGDKREDISTSELKERIIRLLNYPKEFIKKSNMLYKFTVYTPQEEMKSILQERTEVRLDTLRYIFGIDRYKKIKENSNFLLQKIKESIRIKEVLIAELNLLKEKFTIENEKKILLARDINNTRMEYEKLNQTKNEIEERLNSTQKLLEEKRQIDLEISKATPLLSGKKDLEERMNKEISIMKKQIKERIDFSPDRLRNVNELLNKHKRILEEKNNDFMNISSRINLLNSQKENPLEIKEKINSLEKCPTCFQGISHEHKEKISKKIFFEIEDINRELEEKIVQKQIILRDIEREKELVSAYEFDKTTLQENKIKWEHQKIIETKIKSDIFIMERTTNEILEIKKNIEDFKKKFKTYESSQEKFDLAKKEFLEINEISKSKEIILATKNKELEILKGRLEELNIEILNKQKIREQINHLRNLQDWFSERFISMINLTEKNVMSQLRQEFSSIFSEWFSILTSESLFVRLDEEFTPIITNQDYEIDYDFLSGGERTAVALAYRLAINQVLNSMLSRIKTKDIVILDEPTDGFASEQIDKMRDIFYQLKAKQIILVSHEQKIEGFVDHIIRVKKEGTSKIEEIIR